MPAEGVDDAFRERMISVFPDSGATWLESLSALLDEYAARWRIQIGAPFHPLSYGYVAAATRADGTRCVLKASVPRDDLRFEIAAMHQYDGIGAVRLLEVDVDAGVMLLERAEPGTPIMQLPDDGEATRIAAGVMRSLWRPGASRAAFPTVADWGRALPELRARHHGGTGSLPVAMFERGEHLYQRLVATQGEQVVLHGDLHHMNILRGTRAPWLAIDPHGVVGEPAFEVGAWMRNAVGDQNDPVAWRRNATASEQRAMLARRLDIFTAELGIDRDRLRDWSIAIAVLSAAWSDESGHGDHVRHTMRIAQYLCEI